MNKKENTVQDYYEITCNEIEEKDGIKEGAHVRYIGIKEDDGHLEIPQYCGFPSDPRGILDFETIYEIEYRIIARAWSKVKLVGFREDEFSPSIFEAIDKNEEKKRLKAGGHVRYVGPKNDILDYETIYEVEKTGMHYFGIGFPDIELVGFEGKFDRRLFEKVVKSETAKQ
jgi:hypothetical protein